MKSIIVSMAVAAGLMVAGSAMATDMPKEAGKCKACHKIDGKQVGPGWKQVAEKYKGDKDAASKILANIKAGGKFGWNFGQMPARGMEKDDAVLESLSKFIAGLK